MSPEAGRAELDPAFEALLRDIKEQRGFDFGGYKRATLARRVGRRMSTLGIPSVEDYADHLAVHPEEFTALFNTILINVTAFFRDRDSWEHLRTAILPGLIADRLGPIRAWSAGCASGEEAFTLAMLLSEQLGLEAFQERVKIYATDIDEEALATARQAVYTDREVQGVPPPLLERYFEPHGQRFALRKELRRAVIFGRNDLLQDAPISRVDVLTCRNTLMYFNAQAQAEILSRLHFGLNHQGILFLGKAEMLLSHTALFRPIDLKRRFFQKIATDSRERRLIVDPLGQSRDHKDSTVGRLQQAALMSSASAQLVLDVEGRLVLANARAGHFFGLTGQDLGRAFQDLEVSYRPLELRSHRDQVVRERRPVWVRGVAWARSGQDPVTFDVQVVPLLDEGGRLLGTTVMFHDVSHHRLLQQELTQANRQLETAYEEMQSTNEELETTNEELQSTVEELETTNEELQSTNEELETMNEELQSMNDELHLSNEALQERQDEVARLNAFLASILSSLTAGVAVVDKDLRILAWNARSEDLWGIRTPEALGEHLLNLDIGLPLEQVRPSLRAQLAGSDSDHETLTLPAVNRRGRSLQVRVTVTGLRTGAEGVTGAILVMDPEAQPG